MMAMAKNRIFGKKALPPYILTGILGVYSLFMIGMMVSVKDFEVETVEKTYA